MKTRKILNCVCALFLACGFPAMGQETNGSRLPVQVVPWDGLSKRLQESEIVVIGLVDTFDAAARQDESGNTSTPGAKLGQQLSTLRKLGGDAVPGLKEKVLFSEKISVFVVESNKEQNPTANEAQQEKARAIYQMLDAPPYVMSNPTIFLVKQGKLVRCYGSYHEPGSDGRWLRDLVIALLSPEDPAAPSRPEIVMMKALALRQEKGNQEAIDYLSGQFLKARGTSLSYSTYSYFWTEAQVRSGAVDPVWGSMIYDVMFTICQKEGDFEGSMQVVSNLCSTLASCGRFGRLAEVMAVWEKGQKLAGNRMDISSYPDLGPAIACLPDIRHRDMPITQPSPRPVPAGSNAGGFHVNDAGAFANFASLRHAAGRWKEAMEYTIWIRDWATDDKTKQPIGEFATSWYGATSNVISNLKYMGFREEALALVEEGLAAPHGQTYHGRWKIFLAADHLHSLVDLDRAPSDTIAQYAGLIEKARHNGHINKGGVWDIQNQMAQALLKAGRTKEAEALYAQLVSEGSLVARRARLTHWIKSGRVDGVEEELKSLLKFSRQTGQKMYEYGLYRDYADFLEKAGRHGEALLIRREVIRLAKIFGLFTHLPIEQSKLAILLMRLGDQAGSEELAKSARAQIKGGRLPKSIVDEINANLSKLGTMIAGVMSEAKDAESVDLQPGKSMVIPLADLPWTTYLTLTNPGKQVKEGRLLIQGQAVQCSASQENDDITIKVLGAKSEAAPEEFACSIEPGTFRLIHLHAGAETKAEGEIQITWRDARDTSHASVTLEAPESGVSGAIIQAGDYRANPFYGLSMFVQYVSKEAAAGSPPLRFVCSQPSRVEVYKLDETPLAIGAQGNGSLRDQGDELFADSDGAGNLILPLSNGQAGMNLRVFPEKGIPDEGLTVDIEAFVGGAWQSHSSNRLAK